MTLVAIAAVWAPAIDNFSGLFAYLQQGFTYVTAPLVATFLSGMLSKRIGATAAIRGTIAGHLFSLSWFIATQIGWIDLHFTIVAGVLLVVTLAAIFLMQVVSSETPSAKQLQAVDRSRAPPVPTPIKWLSCLLALVTLAMVWVFR
mgnify:FL=1